jgi:hypothetical protein
LPKRISYQALEKHCSTLVANGYREMPLEMYLNWLFEVRAKGTAFLEVPRKPKLFDTQKGNPHRHDTTFKIEVQTLTNGRYDEFPELAETTYVGSAVYDVYEKRIIGFVRRDTLYGEANLEPEVVSRWLSTDPIHHPYQSPYVGFDNNPVYYVDPNGTTVGDYYSKDGYYVGSDGKNDNKVYAVSGELPKDGQKSSNSTLVSRVDKGKDNKVVEKNFYVEKANIQEIKLTSDKSMTHTQFLDRAHWIFGEGRGQAADHYAHTIQNIKEQFANGSEIDMYKSATDGNGGGLEYLRSGKSNPAHKDFIGFRKNPTAINTNSGARACISAVIAERLGESFDPTITKEMPIGANTWAGGSQKWVEDRFSGSYTIFNEPHYYHTFYNFSNEIKRKKQ